MVEPLPRWAKTFVALVALAGLSVWVINALGDDSPWCDDGDDSACPTEAQVAGVVYTVDCTDRLLPVSERDRGVTGVLHLGGGEDVAVRGWTLHSVPASDLIELVPSAPALEDPCGDGSWIGIGPNVSIGEALDLIGGL